MSSQARQTIRAVTQSAGFVAGTIAGTVESRTASVRQSARRLAPSAAAGGFAVILAGALALLIRRRQS